MKSFHAFLIVTVLLLSTCFSLAAATEAADTAAAPGLEAKVYFDLNIGDPEKLAVRMRLIEKTREDLVKRGMVPRIVIGVRGKASNFFTNGEAYVPEADLAIKKNILAQVERFKDAGLRLEQCRLAADMQGIATTDFLPQLELVGNGYVAMITYQHQGYAYVPMD